MPRRPQFILERGKTFIIRSHRSLCALTVATKRGGGGEKRGHQRRSFNTGNFVPITKATCYALRLNHNKEAAEGRDLGASQKRMQSAFGGTVNCTLNTVGLFFNKLPPPGGEQHERQPPFSLLSVVHQLEFRLN